MAKILLVEDDLDVAGTVKDALEFEHHTVESIHSGNEASDRLRIYEYDLAILDIGLPVKSGLDVCREHRARGGSVPILLLTGRGEIEDRVMGLDCGADDYLPKPFHMKELIARVRALLRRPPVAMADVLHVRNITVDTRTGRVMRDGEEIELNAKELSLLTFLMRHVDEFFSVTDLLNRVWHSESDSTESAVRQTMTRLRKKIDRDGERSFISTVKSKGYKIEAH